MIKKIISILIIFLSFCILVACGNDNNTDDDPIITITSENDYVRIGEEMELLLSTSLDDEFIWSVDDEEIASIDEFGFITGLSKGEVTVTAVSSINPKYTQSINIRVLDKVVNKISLSGINYGDIGDKLLFKVTLFPKGMKCDYSITVKDPNIATVNSDNTIDLINHGVTSIIVKALDEAEYEYEYKIACCDFSNFLVDASLEANHNEGDKIVLDNVTYYYGFTAVSTFSEINNKLIDNCTIRVNGGTYTDNLSIKKNNIKVIGYDYPVIKSTITLVESVKNVTIEGLNINDGHIILNGANNDILIQNNNFLLSSTNKDASPFIRFNSANEACNNINIYKNTFLNSKCDCINISGMNNLKITENKFSSISGNCIYFNNPSPSQSTQWLIKDNLFESSYRAICSLKMSGLITSYDAIISIFDNTFNSLSDYCIYLDGNNNSTVSLDAYYNNFNNCKYCIYVDTVEESVDEPKLHATFNYNNFTGTQSLIYFKTSDENINTINAKYNYFSANNTQVDFNTNKNLLSSNVNIDERKTEEVNINDKDKIYGKSVLYLDEITSFVCENANKFTTNDNSVLTIDNNGKVNPLKIGSTVIKAYKDSTLINSITVNVYGSLQVDYATELLKVAYTQEGYHEGANNLTKYGEWYAEQVHDKSFANGAWCAMYVSWCANQAKIPTSVIPLYASCAIGRSWFESRGLFKYKEDYKPKAGDIIFFLSNGASHTGIVITYDSKTGTVYTIEGNTSDMCAKRSYAWNNARITGYGTPQYPKFEGKQTVEFDVSGATDGSGASTR